MISSPFSCSDGAFLFFAERLHGSSGKTITAMGLGAAPKNQEKAKIRFQSCFLSTRVQPLRGSAESGAQPGKLLFDWPYRRRREGRVGGQIQQVIEMDDARLQPQGFAD